MPDFVLVYDVVDNFAERRVPVRDAHLQNLREANARGLLLLSGPLGDPADGALLIFRADSAAVVEDFARADPYVQAGLITTWRVRPWTVVIGTLPA